MAKHGFLMLASALLLRSVLAIDLDDPDQCNLLQDIAVRDHTHHSSHKKLKEHRPIAQSAGEKGGEKGCGGRGLFVAYLSAPGNRQRRSALREKCLQDLKDHGVPYRFFIGRPHFPDQEHHKLQGSISTPEEIEHVHLLRIEQDEYADLRMVPFVDQYKDLSDKIFNIFQYGLDHCYDLVLKIDDDMCPDVTALQPLLEAAKRGEALYDGKEHWKGNEYLTQRGPDSSTVPYFSGWCYAISRAMAFTIFEEDAFDTVLFQDYGTDSDDNNMGRWVQRAKARFGNKLQVKEDAVWDICHQLPSEESVKESHALGNKLRTMLASGSHHHLGDKLRTMLASGPEEEH